MVLYNKNVLLYSLCNNFNSNNITFCYLKSVWNQSKIKKKSLKLRVGL